MAFMEPQITNKIDWYVIDTNCGIWYIPVDVPSCTIDEAINCFKRKDSNTEKELIQYTEGTELIDNVAIIKGYGVRLSAPGYMDCTDWDVYANKKVALRAVRELKEEE